MKAYFSDRHGKKASKNAALHLQTFSGDVIYKDFPEWVSLPKATTARVLKKTLLPEKEEWQRMVASAKATAPKVVLARTCRLELDQAPDPFAITASLPKEGAFVFCIQSGEKAFLGATPERLLAHRSGTYFTEAMAGTRKRGKTDQEDILLEQELLSSQKDLSEFHFVRNYLHPFQFGPVTVHKTNHVQHLYSVGTAELNYTEEQLIEMLHPTPALCGVPKEKAYQTIVALEPFDRFLYGGVLGWNTGSESEYIVPIRSCLLEGNIATLYSGAGIVAKSDADAEWEELNDKLKLYDSVFTH